MTNKDIAKAFQQLAKVMELHQENPFKVRSYQNAYMILRKMGEPLDSMSLEALESVSGIGKAIAEKIHELVHTGQMNAYNKLAEKTPRGVLDMLEIPGLGPKKVRTLWLELGMESVGELLYACNENRLLGLTGFGLKTQKEIIEGIAFFQQHRNTWLRTLALHYAEEARQCILSSFPGTEVIITGSLRRFLPTVDSIDLLWIHNIPSLPSYIPTSWTVIDDSRYQMVLENGVPITIQIARPEEKGKTLWKSTGSPEYVAHFDNMTSIKGDFNDEEDFLRKVNIPFHIPEWRENAQRAIQWASRKEKSIQKEDIKGVIHAHSTWSDGTHTLREMALACLKEGYVYLVISEHSKSAFYANGLTVERVLAQHEEINALNQELAPFYIFKGIESDILSDGNLDYDELTLNRFEVIIASIHSNLRMDEEKAMSRLLGAIAHPRTHILGHMTGRLLLSRPGYPVNHEKIIEACAKYNVAIELNANPLRLDMDYQWIPLAMEHGVRIAINPDAHAAQGIGDIAIGVHTALKGGLTVGSCLNCLSKDELLAWLKS